MNRFKIFIISVAFILNMTAIPAIAASTIYIDKDRCYAVKNDDSLWTWEYGKSDMCEKLLDNIDRVCCNYAVATDGSLWTWGNSLFGEFETPTVVMEDVRDIDANRFFAFIVTNDNSLWAVGSNSYNEMGLDDYSINTSKPIKVMNNVKKAVIGDSHGVILKTDGSIITTGLNKEGELGIGKSTLAVSRANVNLAPANDVYAGTSSSYVKIGNTLWMWGTTYEFEESGSIYMQYMPKEYLEDAKQAVSRTGYDIILKNDGSVWFYGAEREEKKGCIDTGDKALYINLPYHIMDNVNSISEGKYDFSNKELLLSNDRVLYECSLEKAAEFVGTVNIKASSISDIKEPSPITDTERTYTDIEHSAFKNEITALTKAGVINGITADKFMPDKALTRAEAAGLMLRMVGRGDRSAPCIFSDVTPDMWYYEVAGASQSYGIIDGFDDNTFRGENAVSDLQLAVLAARTLKKEGTAIEPYPEPSITVPANIPDWAADDISYAIKYGILTEDEAGKLSDKKGMTRGEAAVILYRLYKII